MTIQSVGFGVSNLESTQDAVREAVSQALAATLGDDDNTNHNNKRRWMAFCSATVSRDMEEVRQAFADHLPAGTCVHGTTSSGSILTAQKGSVKRGVACLLLSSSSGSSSSTCCSMTTTQEQEPAAEEEEEDFVTAFDMEDGGKAAAALYAKLPHPKAIYMGATPGAEESVLKALGGTFPGVPVFGGTAADDELTGEWRIFSRNEISATGVSLVGIRSSVKFGASMIGPYSPTSMTAVATKTEGRRVFEIDGRPAADWVYEWLGKPAKIQQEYEEGGMILGPTAQKPIAIVAASSSFPSKSRSSTENQNKKKNPLLDFLDQGVKAVQSLLGVKEEEKEYISCHCAAFGGPEKWVDFFAPIPQGATLIVMDSGNGPSTGYAKTLADAYMMAQAQGCPKPKAALLVFCGGMAIAVGDQLDAGLTNQIFTNQIKDLPCLGMTCFGEQAHLPKLKTNVQCNLSLGMVLFG